MKVHRKQNTLEEENEKREWEVKGGQVARRKKK